MNRRPWWHVGNSSRFYKTNKWGKPSYTIYFDKDGKKIEKQDPPTETFSIIVRGEAIKKRAIAGDIKD